jgi:nicotinate-nucleotide pyrophosphorylase (carboxylating)
MKDIERFLLEDVGRGDLTAELVVPDTNGRASIICERDAVVAGIEEACMVFSLLGADASPVVEDGDRVAAGDRIVSITGPVRGIITAERTALNFLMRMSGIATATAKAAELLGKDSGTQVCGTRKTTPGFRKYEKKAIRLGGGAEHRFGLYDMILIKDNHIKACGSVENAMTEALKTQFHVKVEIEVNNVADAVTVAEMGADIVMADNMEPEEVRKLRDAVKEVSPKVLVEASGDITLDNIADFAGCADLVSMGSLTHSVTAVQFSLDLD